MFAQPNEIYQMPHPNNNANNSYNQLLSRLNLQVIRQQYDAYQQQHQQQQHQQQQQQHQHQHSHEQQHQHLQQHLSQHQQQQLLLHQQTALQQQHFEYFQRNDSPVSPDELPMNHQPGDAFEQRNSEISNHDQEQLMGAASPSTPSPTMRASPNKISKRSKSRDSKDKTKRIRTIFTPEQLRLLEEEFARQMYLVGKDRDDLSNFLGLSQAQVKVWFQNRRIKYRKTMGSS